MATVTAASAAKDEQVAHRFAKDQLKAFVERVERLEEEKKALADDVRDVWSVTRCVKTAMDGLLPPGEPFAITGFSFGGMVPDLICSSSNSIRSSSRLICAFRCEGSSRPSPVRNASSRARRSRRSGP